MAAIEIVDDQDADYDSLDAGNLIAGNMAAGVRIDGAGGGNAVQGNAIYANGGLAIDLGRRDDRRKRREDTVAGDRPEFDANGSHPWFDSESSDDETRSQLESKLKELPQKFAEVIMMKIWGERTFAEIAEILDISQNTAASRYRYGLEALKKSLSIARRRGDLSI